MNPPPLSILFQPPNRVGLGHISRLAAIALAVREIDPSIRVPFAVEGAGHSLLDSLGLPCLPLPSTHDLYKTPPWKAWTVEDRSSLAADISRAIVRRLAPGAVIFDCFPSMALAAAAVETNTPIVLCMREMRDPETYPAMLGWLPRHISAVIVARAEGEVTVPKSLRAVAHYAGPIARMPRAATRTRSAGQLRVVVTGGGGGDGFVTSFYNLALAALAKAKQQNARIDCQLVAGPLFDDWPNLRLVDGVRVLPYVPDLPSLLASADLVICQAGYNTIAEVEQARTRVICIPAPRLYDDQHLRAQKMAQTYPHFRVHQGTDAASLSDLIRESLDQPAPEVAIQVPPGNRVAAEFLVRLVRKTLQSGAAARES